MSSTSDWVTANLAAIAGRQGKVVKPLLAKPKPVGEREQVRRFIAGEERARLIAGEITGEQYTKYCKAMGKKLGVI